MDGSSPAQLAVGARRRRRIATPWAALCVRALLPALFGLGPVGLAGQEQGPSPDAVSVRQFPAAAIEVRAIGFGDAAPGDTLRVTLQVLNRGSGPATQIEVRQPIATSRFLSASDGGRLVGDVVVWPSLDVLGPGEVRSYQLRLIAGEPGDRQDAIAIATASSPGLPSEDGDAWIGPVRWDGTLGTELPSRPDAAAALVAASADVAIRVTGPGTTQSADTVEYLIEVRNDGPNVAEHVLVRDILPANATFLSATGGGTEQGGIVSWPQIQVLRPLQTVTYRVRVRAPVCGITIVNAATASARFPADPDPTNNSASATTVVSGGCALPDVAIGKFAPIFANAGDTITYAILVTNLGGADATDVVVVDTLPAGFTFVDATPAVSPAPILIWPAIPRLAVGDTVQFTVRGSPARTGLYVNTATVTLAEPDTDPSNNASTARTIVQPRVAQPDIAVTKDAPATIGSGDTLTYTITVRNIGADSAFGIVMRDSLPGGTTYVAGPAGASEIGGEVMWTIPAMGPNAVLAFAIRVVAPAGPGTLINIVRASVTSPVDPDTTNNRDDAVTQVGGVGAAADVVVEKRGPSSVSAGDTIDYAIIVFNRGPDAAFGVQLRDALPPGAQFVSSNPSAIPASGVIQWPIVATLPAADTLTYSIQVVTPGPGACAAVVENVAVVTSTSPSDPDPGNNSSRVQTLVSGSCPELDIALVKDTVGAFRSGGEGVFRFTVRNNGPVPTTGPITVTDQLPAGLTFISGSGSGWLITGTGRDVMGVFSGILGPGEETSFQVRVSIDGSLAGQVCNTGFVETEGDNADDPNNVSTVCFHIGDSQIRVEKVATPRVISRGGLVEYRVRVEAIGTVDLMNVVVTDRLPIGFRYVAGTTQVNGTGATDPSVASRDVTWHIGTVRPGSPVEITYRARVGPGTPLGDAINYARAEDDGGRMSNPDSAVVEVRQGELSDEAMIAGRVFLDSIAAVPADTRIPADADCACAAAGNGRQDAGEPGIPGVAVYLQDGTAAITDADGRFVFYGLRPRTWVVRIDPSSLPAGTELERISNRHSDDGGSVLVDLKRGELFRADFAAIGGTASTGAEIEDRKSNAGEILRESLDYGPGSHQGPPSLGLTDRRFTSLAADPLGASFDRGIREPSTADSLPRVRVPDVASTAADTSYGPGFLIGFLEARLDRRSVASGALTAGRDRFEDALRDIASSEDDGRTEAGARAALFYRGALSEDLGLTVRLDSERDEEARLFRDIRPNELYPVWGDGSVRRFDAVSRNRFYARVEHGASHITYGDFNTGRREYGRIGGRILGEYARTLNGAFHQLDTDRLSVSGFASRERSSQVIDVIPGEGVSGPYLLSRTDVLVNSERIEIVTRDREQPAVIRSVRLLERYVDYTIEPLTGRLILKEPVPSLDADFNPVEIRVTYEVETGADRFWVYGLGAQLRPAGFLEVGGNAVRDDDPGGRFDLASVNATAALGANTRLSGEIARTDSAGVTEGDAYRLELRHASSAFAGRVFWLDTDASFRNPSSAIGRGREELGFIGRVRLDSTTSILAEGLRTEDAETGSRRSGGRLGVERVFTDWLTGRLSYRRAEEDGTPADSADVNAIGVRLTTPVPGSSRAQVFGEFEQDLGESDRRRLELGVNVRLFDRVRLYGRHEILRSLASPYDPVDGRGRNATLIGLSGGGSSGESLFSEYRIAEGINGREAQAAIGLRNRWQVADGTRLSTSFERLSPVGGPGRTTTAATAAAEFTGSEVWKASSRFELRSAGGEENVFGSLGYARRLSPDLTFLGSTVVSGLVDGGRAYERTRLGLAYRESTVDVWNGLIRYEHRYERDLETVGIGARRSAHLVSAHADVKPDRALVLRGQWVSKFVSEKRAGLETSERAHLLGARGTLDLTSWLDLGAIGRTHIAGDAGYTFGLGAELGLVLVNNLRIAAGYNVFGFRDRDFSVEEQTDRGPYFQIGYKFDEGLFRREGRGAQSCECQPRPPTDPTEDPRRPPEPTPDPVDIDVTIRGPDQALWSDTLRFELTFRPYGGGAASTHTEFWLRGRDRGGVTRTDTVRLSGDPLEPGSSRTEIITIDLTERFTGLQFSDSLIFEWRSWTPAPDPDTTNDRGRIVVLVWPRCEAFVPADQCAPNPMPVVTVPDRIREDTVRASIVWRNTGFETVRLGRRIVVVPPGTVPVEPVTPFDPNDPDPPEIPMPGGPRGDSLRVGETHEDSILLRITETVGRIDIRVRLERDGPGGEDPDPRRGPRARIVEIDPRIQPFPRPLREVCAGRHGPVDGRCIIRLNVTVETPGGVEGQIVPVIVTTRNVGLVPAPDVSTGARIDDRRWWAETGGRAVSESTDWLAGDTIQPGSSHTRTLFVRCPAADLPFHAYATAGGPAEAETDTSVPCRPRPEPPGPERPPDPPIGVSRVGLAIAIEPVRVTGRSVRFRVTTSNTGTGPATNVRTSVYWPTGAELDGPSDGATGTGVVDWLGADLGVRDSISYTVDLLMTGPDSTIVIEAEAESEARANDRTRTTVIVQQIQVRDTIRITDTITIAGDTIRQTIVRTDTMVDTIPRRVTVPPGSTVVVLPGQVDRSILRWLLILTTVLITSLIVFVISEIIRRWRTVVVAPVIPPPVPVVTPPPPEEPSGPVPLIGGTVGGTTKRVRDIEHVRGIVSIDGVRGTGFLIERDRWMTSAHVVQKRGVGGAITIQFGSNRVVHATIEKLDTQSDLAVLKLATPIDDIEPLEFSASVPVSPSLVSFGFREHGAETWTESDGVLSEVNARDRYGRDTMVILATSLTSRIERGNDLAGAPVLEGGKIVGIMRGRVPHPDSIEKQFSRLLYATSSTRALELLGRAKPAADPAKKGIPIRPDDCCEGDERYAFVCYVGADDGFARRLANRLEGGGFRLFLGRQEMAGRSRLAPEERNALENSRFGLILFSRHWHARSEQLEEATALFRRAAADANFRLLTLRLDGTPLPPEYAPLETIDFCGERPDQGDAIRELTRTMFAVKDETHEMVREEFDRATDDVIREMIEAGDAAKRIRAMAHRWRELRMPGVEPDLCAIDLLLEAGRPEYALEVYDRIPTWVRSAVRARQLHARILLALDRPEEAAPVLEALGNDGHLDAAMGLHLGDALLRRWNESGRRSHAHLRKAFEMYRTCYHRTSDVHAGLHAAALALFLEDADECETLTAELLAAEKDVERPDGHEAAAFGGACLLAGRVEEALEWFERAVAHDPDAAEEIAAMHRVIGLIVEKSPHARTVEARIAEIFHVPGVAAFAGPHIDGDAGEPDEGTEERALRVRARIRARLDAAHFGHGVCSAGDRHALDFAEEVLERGGRVDLVLPYDAGAFAYAGIPAQEVERFERVASHARVRVHELDHVPGLDRDAAHKDSEARVRDLARRRAEARNGKAALLIIRDEDAPAAAPTARPEAAPAPAEAPSAASGEPPAVARADVGGSGMRDFGRRRTEAGPVVQTYRKVHALVVGIDAYEHWPQLSNARQDAKGVGDMLERQYGAYVRRLENGEANAKRIEEIIKNVLREEVQADDLVVFYFAGHGDTRRLGNDVEHGFLVPVDAKEDSIADLMSLQDVTAWTEYLNCRHVLYILDACFSGFAGQAGGVTRRGGAHEARIAISAGTAEQAVFDGGAEGGWTDHSVFTGYLLRGLESDLASSERPIDETMLIGYLRENVLRATRGKQTPVYGFLPGHGSDYIRLVPRERA